MIICSDSLLTVIAIWLSDTIKFKEHQWQFYNNRFDNVIISTSEEILKFKMYSHIVNLVASGYGSGECQCILSFSRDLFSSSFEDFIKY